MRKILIAIICSLFVFTSNAQRQTRTETIHENKMMKENIAALYITDGERTDTLITFVGKDHRYMQLIEYITMFSSTPQEFYDFLCEVDDFYEKEKDNVGKGGYISREIKGHRVHLVESYNRIVISIYEKKENGDGFHGFRPKQYKKLIPLFKQWCAQKGIKLQNDKQ